MQALLAYVFLFLRFFHFENFNDLEDKSIFSSGCFTVKVDINLSIAYIK